MLRHILPFVCLSLLLGCGDFQNPMVSAVSSAAKSVAKSKDTTPRLSAAELRASLTPDVLAQIGAPVIVADLPSRNSAAVLVLSGRNGDVDTYASSDGISISLRHGKLIATRGFGFDLMSANIHSGARTHRTLDGENQLIATHFSCSTTNPGGSQSTETCRTETYAFENKYWRSASGAVTKSQQWISPETGYIIIQRVSG